MSDKDSASSKFDNPQDEPLFMAISEDDPAMLDAYERAYETAGVFQSLLEQKPDAFHLAKLRFRDPDELERLGEDRHVFMWLHQVCHHDQDNLFSGVFFEVPPELQKWHQPGQRLGFQADSIFDWMVNENGHLHGGFTLRVARDKLPEAEREAYDRYVGVSVYEPLP